MFHVKVQRMLIQLTANRLLPLSCCDLPTSAAIVRVSEFPSDLGGRWRGHFLSRAAPGGAALKERSSERLCIHLYLTRLHIWAALALGHTDTYRRSVVVSS